MAGGGAWASYRPSSCCTCPRSRPERCAAPIVSGYQFCITLGILLASCVVYATQDRRDPWSYRIPIGVQFIWALILGVGLYLLPESPRHHVRKGHLEAAAEALSVIRGQPKDSEYIRDELAEIIANHEYETQEIPTPATSVRGSACFKGSIRRGNSNLRRTLLGSGLQCFQRRDGHQLHLLLRHDLLPAARHHLRPLLHLPRHDPRQRAVDAPLVLGHRSSAGGSCSSGAPLA